MIFASVCSGIEAPSIAWEPLGWRPLFFSEINGFARAVLEQRFGARDARHVTIDAPLNGAPILWSDFTSIRRRTMARCGVDLAQVDVLIGGTPCQSFSVAGKRLSLDDARGNLSLSFIRLADAIDNLRRARGLPPLWIVWENVPGVLSTRDNALGCFLGQLVGSDTAIPPTRGGKWTRAGVVSGPRRAAAWRCLDARYQRLAQRRDRLFVVAGGCAGPWGCADALLPLLEGGERPPPPRRKARQDIAGSVADGVGVGGAPGVETSAVGGNNTSGPIEISPALTAHSGPMGRIDFESETFVVADVAPTLLAGRNATGGDRQPGMDIDTVESLVVDLALTLLSRKEGSNRVPGLDADTVHSLIPIAIQGAAGRENLASGPGGAGFRTDGLAYTLEARAEVQAVAFDARQSDVVVHGDVSGTLDTDGHSVAVAVAASPAIPINMRQASRGDKFTNNRTIGGAPGTGIGEMGDPSPTLGTSHPPAVAFSSKDHGADAEVDLSPTLRAMNFDKSHANAGGQVAVATPWQVRRLMPVECERLQGFPDGHTNIAWKGKTGDAPDGPRYITLGNSQATTVINYIGRRIEAISRRKAFAR